MLTLLCLPVKTTCPSHLLTDFYWVKYFIYSSSISRRQLRRRQPSIIMPKTSAWLGVLFLHSEPSKNMWENIGLMAMLCLTRGISTLLREMMPPLPPALIHLYCTQGKCTNYTKETSWRCKQHTTVICTKHQRVEKRTDLVHYFFFLFWYISLQWPPLVSFSFSSLPFFQVLCLLMLDVSAASTLPFKKTLSNEEQLLLLASAFTSSGNMLVML